MNLDSAVKNVKDTLKHDRSTATANEAAIVSACERFAAKNAVDDASEKAAAAAAEQFVAENRLDAPRAESPPSVNSQGDGNVNVGGGIHDSSVTINQAPEDSGYGSNELLLENARTRAEAAMRRAEGLAPARRCASGWRAVSSLLQTAHRLDAGKKGRSAGETFERVAYDAEQIERELLAVDSFMQTHAEASAHDRARAARIAVREREKYESDRRELQAQHADMGKYLDAAGKSNFEGLTTTAEKQAAAGQHNLARQTLASAFNLLQRNAHDKRPEVYIYFERHVSSRDSDTRSAQPFPSGILRICVEERTRVATGS